MQSVSVAMASYNGEKYIKEQLESILKQLKDTDEVIISLDPSTDATEQVIHCKNDIIFLSDQDDIWLDGKVEGVLSAFKEDTMVVMHDATIVDNDYKVLMPSFFKMKNVNTGFIHNLIKNGYIGCCMAFRRELVKYIVPIPTKIYMHDQWIGMVGDECGENVLIQKSYLYYRRHGDNVSEIHHGTILEMLVKRIHALEAYFELKRRLKK